MAAVKPPEGAALSRAVADIVGTEIADHDLLARAFTHASAPGAAAADYQRLEFLGDRVLALTVAEMLFNAHPHAPEGELSLRLNALVNAETLARIADETGLSRLIRAGSEMKGRDGRRRVNLHADVVEALIAVVFLEAGLDAARAFVRRYWEPLSQAPEAARRDAKTQLQEWAHSRLRAVPIYAVTGRSGPDHDPLFEVTLRIEGVAEARGSGRSKREAERAAAAALLVREGIWRDPEETQ